jgi:uncharacterized membrane protein YtjA (UPF0391 family)
MEGLYKTLNIIAIILAIIAAVFCFTGFFTKNKPDSSRFGLSIDQAYGAASSLFLLALVIWVGCMFNFRMSIVNKLNDVVIY